MVKVETSKILAEQRILTSDGRNGKDPDRVTERKWEEDRLMEATEEESSIKKTVALAARVHAACVLLISDGLSDEVVGV